MNGTIAILSLTPTALLLAYLLLPSRVANQFTAFSRTSVSWLVGLQMLIGLAAVLQFGLPGRVPQQIVLWSPGETAFQLSVHYDAVSSLMLTLVAFVGWVICRYAVRYLDGDENQGRFYRWTAFTLGSVFTMVAAGNLLLLFVGWVAMSLGLNQLLLHFSNRPAAAEAAKMKFVISRLGDAAFLVAIGLIYSTFQTWEFDRLFELAALRLEQADLAGQSNLTAIGFLLVLAAITKSAQFPFHVWLPNTLETPTPTSALMHAGIVNAGGYLMIRVSPLLALSPSALVFLAIIGGLTAVFAVTVMSTQTSVKKSLAYSTVAQMGFMMLQCGLGAYSAAMLHILAHSLYKAHAFLSSGSVVAKSARLPRSTDATAGLSAWMPVAVVVNGLVIWCTLWLAGMDLQQKPGGLLLGAVMAVALAHWATQSAAANSSVLIARSMGLSIALCAFYGTLFVGLDRYLAISVGSVPSLALSWTLALAFVLLTGAALVAQQWVSRAVIKPAWLPRLYVHASNGFYLETYFKRFLAFASTT